MAEITAPVIRSTVTDDEFGGFRITIPGIERRRVLFAFGFAVWGLVTVLVVSSFVTSPRQITFEQWQFLGFWALAGLLGTMATVRYFAREVLIIEGKLLILRKELAGFRWAHTFELAAVRNLRPMRSIDENNHMRRPDMVAFDHKGRTYHFGRSLSEQEVMRLIKTIHSKFPIRHDWDDVEPLPVLK